MGKRSKYSAEVRERAVRLVMHHTTAVSIPELDPSAAGSAVVLLLGGVAYIASRRREEDLA